MARPLISIIIPTHNSEIYIKRIIETLLAQTFTSFEALFIDSSTKDKTSKILSCAAEIDERIKIISDSNASYGHKINRGIDGAEGEYIAILESDDEYAPDFLEKLYNSVDDVVDFVKGNYSIFADTEFGRKESLIKIDAHNEYGKVIDLAKQPEYRYSLVTRIWCGLYKKSFLIDNNIICNESEGASFQDTGFSILCATYAKKIKLVNNAIYYYRVDNNMSSSKDNGKTLLIQSEWDWIIRELYKRNRLSKEINQYIKDIKLKTYYWNAKRLNEISRNEFLKAVKNELEREYVDYIGDAEQELILQFLLGINNEIYDRDCNYSNEIYEIIKTLINKKIILWGCGAAGKAVLEMQRFIGSRNIKRIVDNSKSLQMKNLYEYTVQAPVFEKNEINNMSFIVASKNYCDEIENILIKEGVTRDRIFVYKNTVKIPDDEIVYALGDIISSNKAKY